MSFITRTFLAHLTPEELDAVNAALDAEIESRARFRRVCGWLTFALVATALLSWFL